VFLYLILQRDDREQRVDMKNKFKETVLMNQKYAVDGKYNMTHKPKASMH